jgi:hypothetical protein
MILWLILGVSLSLALIGLVVAAANPGYIAVLKQTRKASKLELGTGAGVLLGLGTFAIPGLWLWYSFDTGDWRFAAIFCAPLAAKLVYRLVKPKQKEAVK